MRRDMSRVGVFSLILIFIQIAQTYSCATNCLSCTTYDCTECASGYTISGYFCNSDEVSETMSSAQNTGKIIGIVAGVIIGLSVIGTILYYCAIAVCIAKVAESGTLNNVRIPTSQPYNVAAAVAPAVIATLSNGQNSPQVAQVVGTQSTRDDASWVQSYMKEAQEHSVDMVTLHDEEDMLRATSNGFQGQRDLGFINFTQTGVHVVRAPHGLESSPEDRKDLFVLYGDIDVSGIEKLADGRSKLRIGGSQGTILLISDAEILDLVRSKVLHYKDEFAEHSDVQSADIP